MLYRFFNQFKDGTGEQNDWFCLNNILYFKTVIYWEIRQECGILKTVNLNK